jgi:hypothetical protein
MERRYRHSEMIYKVRDVTRDLDLFDLSGRFDARMLNRGSERRRKRLSSAHGRLTHDVKYDVLCHEIEKFRQIPGCGSVLPSGD